MTDAVILCGGGLDSGVMAAFAAQRFLKPELLFFDYGQKALRGETTATYNIADHFKLKATVVEIPRKVIPASPLTSGAVITDLNLQSLNEVRGRNLLFLSMAFSYACRIGSVQELWIGSDRPAIPPGFGDQKQALFDGFNITTAFAYGEASPRVRAPLLEFPSKLAFLRQGIDLYPRLFEDTFSCYESRDQVECGICNHCRVKIRCMEALREPSRASDRAPLREHDEAGRV